MHVNISKSKNTFTFSLYKHHTNLHQYKRSGCYTICSVTNTNPKDVSVRFLFQKLKQKMKVPFKKTLNMKNGVHREF